MAKKTYPAELEKVFHSADALAFENKLGRRTTNVIEHPKADTLTITEEVTRYVDGVEVVNRQYRHLPNFSESGADVETEIAILKADITYRSLGKKSPLAGFGAVAVDGSPKPRKSKAKAKAETASEEKAAETEDDLALEKKPAVEAKEKAKAKAKKKITYSIDVPAHIRFVGEIVKSVLGESWREDEANRDAVRDLVQNFLNGKVPVCNDGDTKPLKSFVKVVETFLKERLDVQGDEDDIVNAL